MCGRNDPRNARHAQRCFDSSRFWQPARPRPCRERACVRLQAAMHRLPRRLCAAPIAGQGAAARWRDLLALRLPWPGRFTWRPAVSPGASLRGTAPSRPRACTRPISRASSSTALMVLFRAMLPCAAAWLGARRAPCARSAGPRCALVVTLSAARCLLHTRLWPCHPCETRRGRRRSGARTLPSPWPHRVSPRVQDTRPCRRCPPTGAARSEPAQSGRHMAAEIAREPVHPSLYA